MEKPDEPLTREAVNSFFVILVLALLALAWWIWPSGVLSAPLAYLTIGEILLAITSGAIATGALYLLVWFFVLEE